MQVTLRRQLTTQTVLMFWQVTIEALNDSRQIGMCLYNAVVLSAIGLTLSLLLDDQVVMMYGITAGCTLIGTTATQAIIFIPKVCTVYNIMSYKDIGFTLSLLLDDQVVMMYGITAGCILIGTTATQQIILISKVCFTIFTYIWTASANHVESDLGCTSRIYFYKVTLTLQNVTLTSKKQCQHNNKCDCHKTNGYKWSYVLSIKYRYSDIFNEKYINFIYWYFI